MNHPAPTPARVSVLMPTFEHEAFIGRAVSSLLAQTRTDWELIVVDDGSPDRTREALTPFLRDPRIRYHRLPQNRGLGAALNVALILARGDFIAYLPSDDVYHADHLQSLLDWLGAEPDAVLAYSGVRHHYNRSAPGQIEGEPLQLVQVVHRRTHDRWLERQELVTDDLERMYWHKLRAHGSFVGTGQVTCEWVDHPRQAHKTIRETTYGGINPYRYRYRVQHPMRYHTSVGFPIDEVEQYRRFRDRPDTPPTADRLKILLVGELAYNAERVLALEERGHKLYGLWTPDGYWFNTVGPVPFGHVEDLPRDDWQAAIRRVRPDVIYALLNWEAVPFVHRVFRENPGVPFVWHFKEGPFICLEKGTWRELLELTAGADGRIYSSPEMRDWFATLTPGINDGPTLVLDGDLPKRDWFDGDDRQPLRGEQDGEIHTVVPGRAIGLHPEFVAEMARQGVHLHFYGSVTHGQWGKWMERVNSLAPGHLHSHPQVNAADWVREFSQYDAGWLHAFESENHGELSRANWDDLNYPARIATLAVAGVPLIQCDNTGHVVAAQSLAREMNLGVFYRDVDDLVAQLKDQVHMRRLRENVWSCRHAFTFDHHADRLVTFFRRVMAMRRLPRRASTHGAALASGSLSQVVHE